MISLFDDTGARLPILWHGIDYNGLTDTEWGPIDLGETAGLFTAFSAFSTPFTFVSETEPDIVKTGGGVEIYNLRNASRVMDLRVRLLARRLSERDAWIEEIQSDFTPLKLTWNNSTTWPPSGTTGRPDFVDALPLTFTRLNDGSHNDGIADSWPTGKVELQYYVVPLELPDPIIAEVQQGFAADLTLRFLILDGGRAYSRTNTTLSGDGDITPAWGPAPNYPVFSFTSGGASAANLTITTSGVSGYTPAPLVLDASGLSDEDEVVLNCRDRLIYVNGAWDQSLHVSGDWPIFGGYGDTNSVVWSNDTSTSLKTTTFREATYI